jgi:hypothetical protein
MAVSEQREMAATARCDSLTLPVSPPLQLSGTRTPVNDEAKGPIPCRHRGTLWGIPFPQTTNPGLLQCTLYRSPPRRAGAIRGRHSARPYGFPFQPWGGHNALISINLDTMGSHCTQARAATRARD